MKLSCPNQNGAPFIPMPFPPGISQQNLYETAESIALLSRHIMAAEQKEFAALPFCHTIEAKALGADIRAADNTAGPRPGSYVYSSLHQLTSAIIEDSFQGKQLLRACRLLKQEGIPVIYELCGPVSILSCLMDLSVLFRGWRKEPELVAEVFRMFRRILSNYLSAVCHAGVGAISFADPAGNPGILGPRYSRLLTEEFTLPFLQETAAICHTHQVTLSLCPLTAASLIDLSLITPAINEPGQVAICCLNATTRLHPPTYVFNAVP